MSKIHIKVIQPTQIRIDKEYDHVIIPGVDGDFGISFDHTPFITKIRTGVLQLFQNEMNEEYAIHDGFVTVENNVVKIVCDTIERKDEIDSARAKASKERAEKRLKSSEENINFRRAEASLKKALVRLELNSE
ncbi:MAG: ATP synthase F1 subunit epsilon [Candidatus Cloacimonetes bacterium]|jgi:F-type H+-transporting ATPase subunit epsilon|nr:ATP synthase F1 subunit epsilon [Candidatus Cloacimonadota bacterium]